MRKFKCEMCQGEFETDEPAEEHQGAGPGVPGAASVCGRCFKKLADAFPELKEDKGVTT